MNKKIDGFLDTLAMLRLSEGKAHFIDVEKSLIEDEGTQSYNS